MPKNSSVISALNAAEIRSDTEGGVDRRNRFRSAVPCPGWSADPGPAAGSPGRPRFRRQPRSALMKPARISGEAAGQQDVGEHGQE